MNSFFEDYPQAQSGRLTIDELNKLMIEYQDKINNSPIADFDGLSPEQMNALLHSPFTAGGILQLRKGMDDYLDQVPIFRLSELLISEIWNSGTLKLTTKGNLPVKVCELLHNQNLIKWEYVHFVKKVTEDEIPYIWPLKQYLLDEGILKKRNNRLSLTKYGEKFILFSKATRFNNLLTYFTSHFHWANFYDLEDNGKCGNLGWAYSLVLLSKYGMKSNTSEFYSLKIIRALEKELWNSYQENMNNEAIKDYHNAYAIRFFECFANWFGLVNIEQKRDYLMSLSNRVVITKSSLFDHLFEVI
ncbi:hypothetical protein [Pedobacter lusitanus]